MEILQQNQSSMTALAPRPGLTLAEVTNIKDPENLNRVRCKPITKDEDVKETDWAYVCSFMSGNGAGGVFFPCVGDIVVLGYLEGDAHGPVVLGCVWNAKSKPPYSYQDGKNEIRSIKTPAGTEILLDDTSGKEKITITTKAGSVLSLDDGGKTISLQDKGKKNYLELGLEKGEATLHTAGKITLEAGSGAKLILDGQGGNVKIESNTKIQVKSAQVAQEASGQFGIKANGQMTVESSGITNVKGSMVKIN